MSESVLPTQVAQAWRDMELLSPRRIPDSETVDDQVVVTRYVPGDPLPWEPDGVCALPPEGDGLTWLHRVYLGTFELRHLQSTVTETLGAAPWAAPVPGRGATAGLTVTGDGRPVATSAFLSSGAWAWARCLAGQWADTQIDAFHRQADLFHIRAAELLHGTPPDVLTVETLGDLLDLAWKAAGIDEDSPAAELLSTDSSTVQVVSVPVRAGADRDGVDDLVNSPYLTDLTRMAEAVAGGRTGRGLLSYLGAAAGAPETLPSSSTPDAPTSMATTSLPRGRWPSSPQTYPSLSEQFAVNLTLGDLAGRTGLNSVGVSPESHEAPPIRDVLAGLVVERARRIAALPGPQDAFVRSHSWKGHYHRTAWQPHPSLTGFEMVLASPDAHALDEDTDGLADATQLAHPWEEADHLGDIATQVRHAQRGDDQGHAWGLVAARLGSRENRIAFAESFWTDRREYADLPPTFRSFLERAALSPQGSWQEACDHFLAADAKVGELLEECGAAEERLTASRVANHELRVAQERVDALTQEEEPALARLYAAREAAEKADRDAADARKRKRAHDQTKPGAFEQMLTMGRRMKDWSETADELIQTVVTVEKRGAAAREEVARISVELSAQAEERAQAQEDLKSARLHADELAATVQADRERWRETYPDDAWFADPGPGKTTVPWLDATLNQARSQLFLAALALHRTLFAHSARRMISTMRAALDILSGAAPQDVPPQAALAAWQSFFLVVPLVSTSFSSLGSMFSHLGEESLGWLFIDEAGRACPQAAAGGIWRAQRILVVGDPVAPESTDGWAETVARAMADRYGLVSEPFCDGSSVLHLAESVDR
ncbi:hypothetical protein SAMN05421595_2983 [Austwickia chelonae]|uniref:Uncharacterized protein n=1 Tax=Austwickia chelonae NBRC 105200 TaxID=1184607 RepID=K6VA68_9MICO|nr:hypothetical protein [Austwickia chelonae]GAB79123.1 hypothetical protein AUCHE_19_00270 [Austwickia chelonae NBRC 105200]SEW42463.1 hypothetical protein SAMN05421595_2983 [Austwickia chelonae]